MFFSAESRWFFEGPLPGAVRDWFVAGGRATPEPTRTDEYLLLPGCATTGVKLREGSFEVKAMTHAPEPVGYARGVNGYRDAWVKWSCRANDVEALRRMLGATGDRWAAVGKTRLLRLLSLDSGTLIEVDDKTMPVSCGCQIELTEIGVSAGGLGASWRGGDHPADARWWSLSFEAFAPGDQGVTTRLLAQLEVTVNHCLDSPPPHALDTSSSMSYPGWLLRFG